MSAIAKQINIAPPWKSVRVVYGARLESVCTFIRTESSNLSSSASSLPILAKLLMISVDGLIGTATKKINGKRGPTPKLQQQMERVSLLPRTKQQFVMDMLDTVIQQAAH